MSQLLQEYVNFGSQQLRVDPDAGVIRGVKLLGLSSRNGRRYREDALVEAVNLYEGAKVNINHPKGHPLSPRDYQDRLGMVRGVAFRPNEGLFGDLHFNPNHALSEQLVWDAEHAPRNVGLSHNVLARTSKNGDETVVEAIVKVQSIDLVADPATTSGLFEHAEGRGSSVEGQGPEIGNPSPALDPRPSTLDLITLEQLRELRPDLVAQVARSLEAQVTELQAQLEELQAREALARRRERILKLLQEHDLPLPTSVGVIDSQLVSPQFLESLMRTDDEAAVERLIEERAALVRSAYQWTGPQRRANGRRPRSRDQFAVPAESGVGRGQSAEQFAAALRGA